MLRLSSIAVVVLSFFVLASCSEVPTITPEVENLPSSYTQRGVDLVYGLAACGFCHGEKPVSGSPLTGGRTFGGLFGTVVASNITADVDLGTGQYQTRDLFNLLRYEKRPTGDLLREGVHQGMLWMSDADTLGIISYLRRTKPVAIVQPTSQGEGSDLFSWFRSRDYSAIGYVPQLPAGKGKAQGRYLVDHVARCGACHNGPNQIWGEAPYLAGGQLVVIDEAEAVAPAISPDKLTAYTEDSLLHFFKSGETPSGKQINKALCPVDFYARGSADEISSMAQYLLGAH